MKSKHVIAVLVLFLASATFISGCVQEAEEMQSVSQLLQNPVYDTEVKIYGEVSLLGELNCPCFNFTSGGEAMQVWYDAMDEDGVTKPPVSVEGIVNGDWIIVTGELRAGSDNEKLNDFWASSIEESEGKMKKAKKGDTVKVHYTGKLEDGSVFDTSINRAAMQFKIGEGNLIAAFEEGVVGMEIGEWKTVNIPAEEAYGIHHEELMRVINKSELPEGMQTEVGQQLQMQRPDGQVVTVTISEVTESSITIDANHPLAGKDLTFDIQLVEVD